MKLRPPVQPLRQNLPFHDSAFSWDTFEGFFCDFLNAQPHIVLNDGGKEIKGRVIHARPFARKGDNQRGIDLLAEMEGGEVWDFQCKHVKTWTPAQTRKTIAAYQRDAARRFLLVTCEVSEACHDTIRAAPGWVLWDGREINRRFRDSIEHSKAAPILGTHFGPGWAEAFFGISGDGPLIGAEAKFAPQLRADVRFRFHHRHALIGREALLDELDKFVREKSARVLILTGRGGLGKSRLLLEWSRDFKRRHRQHTLRFLSDKCTDFGPSLQVAPKPLMLVFDDAHYFADVRRALLPELPRREDIKLVLSLRPGPLGKVMQELLGAGFDRTEIIEADPMKPLAPEQQMALVDAALKPEFSTHARFLCHASHDCPLVAVISAELINSGALTSGDLLDEKELQTRVFESMLDDAAPVRKTFGTSQTDDFLRLLALLGPVKLDAKFFTKAAPFIGLPHADHVSHLRDALDGIGLLHTTGAGTRVTPDLLSDHLAYTACYDKAGQSRNFAERLLDSFSPGDFPKHMQHLAEAEWRAFGDLPGAASVVEPLWVWFRARFQRSSFYDRRAQIQEWGNISYLQPARSLELAKLAISSAETPPAAHPSLGRAKLDTHEYSLEWLPKMLAPVAENHPEQVGPCFDILWQLGRDKPSGSSNHDEEHPISVIGDVVTYKLWKSLKIQHAALDWLERLVASDDWRRHLHRPGWLLAKFLEPIFVTSFEDNWMTGNTMHVCSRLLNLRNTASLRERILSLCRELLAEHDNGLALQIIPILERGCDVARLGYVGSPSKEFVEEWNVERLKSLAVLEGIVREFSEPLVHFQIRRDLMRALRYGKDSPVFRDACRKVINNIPSTLDFRIARAVFGSDYDEFERDSDQANRQNIAKARWETFIRKLADSIHEKYATPVAWLTHLAELDARWRAFDSFFPNFRHVLIALAERRPAEGVVAAKILLGEPNHQFARAFDALVIPATKEDVSHRLRLIHAAANSGAEPLQAAAVACCAWWRREGSLPEEAWQTLETIAPVAPPIVADRIVNFVWLNGEQATNRDWNLITALPFAPGQTGLAGTIARRAAELVSRNHVKPEAESVARFLRRFESLATPEGHDIEHAFAEFAEAFPVEMFLTLWRRNEARKAGDGSLKPLPYRFETIRFPLIMNSPEVKAIVAECERRLADGGELDLDERQLLSSAIQHTDDPSAWLEAAANRATTEQQLNALLKIGGVGMPGNPAIAYPSSARALLTRARGISRECHERIFSRLLHVGGVRSSTSGEPDAGWKGVLEAIERLAHQHAADPELGPLFAKMAESQRAEMESHRWSFSDDTEEG